MAVNAVFSISSVKTIAAICTITTVSAVNAVTSVFAVCTYYITGIHQGIVSKAYHKMTAIINSGLFDTNAINAVYTVTTILAVNSILAVYSVFTTCVSCIKGASVAHGKNKVPIFIDVSTYNGNSRRAANGKQHDGNQH